MTYSFRHYVLVLSVRVVTMNENDPVEQQPAQREDERVQGDLATIEAAGTSELFLNYRRLQTIPNALVGNNYCQMSLMKLYLKGNLINQMPCTLWLLQNLKELYLHSNVLQELPAVVCQLPALESLNVACNELTSIPPAIGKMASLKCLNITQNKLTHLPDELWQAPCLEQLLVSSNQLASLSPSVLHCQSLHTLMLDSNHLTELPVQVTRLLNLKHLSVCGNNLTALPSDFSALSKLEVVYADGNPRLYSIPASLTALQSVGVQGCDVSFSSRVGEQSMGYALRILAPCKPALPLIEQAARALHTCLNSAFPSSSSSPYEASLLPSTLPLPTSLAPWLVPRGRCLSPSCSSSFFHYHYSYLVSSLTFQNLSSLPESKKCKVSRDVSVCLDFCSLVCAQNVLSHFLQ